VKNDDILLHDLPDLPFVHGIYTGIPDRGMASVTCKRIRGGMSGGAFPCPPGRPPLPKEDPVRENAGTVCCASSRVSSKN
jgi:hypothetical protein